jgi:hypothetical protein
VCLHGLGKQHHVLIKHITGLEMNHAQAHC